MPDGNPAQKENEEKIRELIARIQLNQQRMDALQQQANLIQLSLNDLDNALKALTTLEGKGEGLEMLVPIGADSFVHARLSDPDRVSEIIKEIERMESAVRDNENA